VRNGISIYDANVHNGGSTGFLQIPTHPGAVTARFHHDQRLRIPTTQLTQRRSAVPHNSFFQHLAVVTEHTKPVFSVSQIQSNRDFVALPAVLFSHKAESLPKHSCVRLSPPSHLIWLDGDMRQTHTYTTFNSRRLADSSFLVRRGLTRKLGEALSSFSCNRLPAITQCCPFVERAGINRENL